MTLESINEAMLCKVFSTTLVGSALIWFHQLADKSFASFEDFRTLFMKKYGSNRIQLKTMRDSHKIDQREDKTLRMFLNRFLDMMN